MRTSSIFLKSVKKKVNFSISSTRISGEVPGAHSLAAVQPGGTLTGATIHLRVYKEALAAGMEPLGENGLCLSELELHGSHLHESVAASVGSAISSLMAPLHHEPQHAPLHGHPPPLHHEPLEKLKCEFLLPLELRF